MISFITYPLAAYGDAALELADDLYKGQYYEESITEYKRYMFFNPGSDRLDYAFRQIGYAYRQNHELEKSIRAFGNAIAAAKNDSLADEIKIDLGVTAIASGNYEKAEAILLKLAYFDKHYNIKAKASLYLCINMIYKYEWSEARAAYANYLKYIVDEANGVYLSDSLFLATADIHLKSPRLAKTLSTFLPGSGQIYAGNWFNGLNALIINGGLGYLAGDSIIEGNYADGILNYFMLFLRYYRGNRHNAETLTLLYNEKYNKRTADSILETIRFIKHE